MVKNFRLNNSLTIENDLNIQGNLNVKGSTNTVNQETLTIKDNLIAVNGNGTTLDATEMVGLIAITGKEITYLKDGTYYFNINKIFNELELWSRQNPEDEFGPPFTLQCNENNRNKIHSILSQIQYEIHVEYHGVYIAYHGEDAGPMCGIAKFNEGTGEITQITTPHKDQTPEEVYIGGIFPAKPIIANNLIVPNDIVGYLLTKDNIELDSSYVTTKAGAYASPIYDKNDDSLKIGLGSYEKDGNGNIKSFTFGENQGQSLVTRPNNLSSDKLLTWDSVTNRLQSTDIVITNKSIAISNRADKNTGVRSLVLGDSITNNANESIVSGFNNTNGENATRSIVAGVVNKNYGPSSAIFGEGNVNNAANSMLFGRYLVNNDSYSIIIGRGNNLNSHALFQIGNGWGTSPTSNTNRSNAFEVTSDGIARAFGKPVGDYDLVTIKKLNEVAEGLGGGKTYYRHRLQFGSGLPCFEISYITSMKEKITTSTWEQESVKMIDICGWYVDSGSDAHSAVVRNSVGGLNIYLDKTTRVIYTFADLYTESVIEL